MLKSLVEFLQGCGIDLNKPANDELKAKLVAEYDAKCWAVFLEYHDNSPWAVAKAKLGGPLSFEAVDYMQREIDARQLRKKLYEERRAKEKADHETKTQQTTALPENAPDDQRGPAAPGVG